MSQGSFFDDVQDRLFEPAPRVSAPSAPVGPSLVEQSAAAQEVHDLWADRLGWEDMPSPCRTELCDGDPDNGEGWDGFCGNCADRLDES